MVQISFAKREILVKIVYYGMGLCGKTTSLQYLHSVMDPANCTKLFSVKTDEDRTLFFDFLPVSVATLNNFKIKLKVYTVPGQVKYNATRKAVLAGVDGVVFVVDSQEHLLDDNLESFEDLKKNLAFYGLDRDTIPMVLQYNKRDLKPVAPVDFLNKQFNPSGDKPFFPTVATEGDGVTDTFLEISKVVMEAIIAKHKLPVGNDILDSFLLSLRVPMKENEEKRSRGIDSENANPEEGRVDIKLGVEPDNQDALLQSAVASNLEMADLYNQLEEMKQALELRIRELITANQISATVVAELDPERVIQLASEVFQRHGEFGVSMLLESDQDVGLTPAMQSRLKEDPLNNIILESGLTAADAILKRNRMVLINRYKNQAIFQKVRGEIPEVRSVIAIPLVAKKRALGLLNLFSYDTEEFRKDTLNFYHLIANNVAIALENARLYKMVRHLNQKLKLKVEEINNYNEQLEDMVRKRTRELRESNRKLERYVEELKTVDKLKDDFMGLMSHELRTPLTSIISYSQSLLEGMVTDEEEQKQFLDVIYSESRHLAQIIERVIDTVNFENERAYVQPEECKLAAMVHHVVERIQPQADVRGVTFEIQVDPLTVVADPVRGEQVIGYVVENAVQYTPEGTSIAIRSESDQKVVRLIIQDAGPGVPEDAADKIFDRFKLMGALEHHSRGLRLSLHLSRLIMTAMDGAIQLANPGEKGACFHIEFPKA